ncbi:outer membrane protein OmpX [Klebsiella sp. BIGb0407]|uniref:outer membrane protein OmpX n=1 Tax=Klebsiella sp. BIGb0407 TaxID=2940603 RepID=UPI0021691BAE|nr:outer membrane protein OmpX [Klebsiella sp. BIGb0407]MCS3430862.1 outer membrane protein X [Klebsiella sp. BIGb0407]
MKKIVCLSALAFALTLSAGTASAATSTVTAGYAQGDMQGKLNKAKGFNLKYRYENESALGYIGSLTYIEKDATRGGVYSKGEYYGVTAGPAYRLNDWVSAYGVIGLGHGKYQTVQNVFDRSSNSDYGFSYGAGLQFNPIENVALDFSYEQSRIRHVDVGTWIVGAGYSF